MTEGYYYIGMSEEFIRKISEYMDEFHMVKKGDGIVIGVSGGADSVALFMSLYEISASLDLKLYVVHVNHGLRPEAKEEAEYVRSLCVERNVPFFLYEEDIAALSKRMKVGTEEAGRYYRYKVFSEVLLKNCPRGKIAVAHNQNDCAETLLFNLFRGTGPAGLASIPPVRDRIIRPLMCVSRTEIESFLKGKGISFYTDKSNLTEDYTRNRIRNKLIPMAKEDVCSECVEHIAQTASLLRELNDFAVEQTEAAFKEIVFVADNEKVLYYKDGFTSQNVYLQKTLLKKAIDELVPNNKDFTHVHFESILSLLSGNGTKSVDLPYGLCGVVSYDTIGIRRKVRKNDNSSFCENLRPGQELIVPDGYELFCKVIPKEDGFLPERKQYTKTLDYGKIKESLVVRTRRPNDYIAIDSMGRKKKLQDYFVNEKIPAEERDNILLLADGNHVLWVIGYRISEDVKVTDSTKEILYISLSKEEEQ